MNIEPIKHILRRCIILLYRKSGTHKTKQEYYYWIDWLKKQLKDYNKMKNIKEKNVDMETCTIYSPALEDTEGTLDVFSH